MEKKPNDKKEEMKRIREEARAKIDKAALDIRNTIIDLLIGATKRGEIVVMEEPEPSKIDAVTNMCRAVSKAVAISPEKFVLVFAHSQAAAARVFRLLYEQTTIRIYLETEVDGSDESSYFNSLYSWVKHRVVVVTPEVLAKKLETRGMDFIVQISLVILCDSFRMKPKNALNEDNNNNDNKEDDDDDESKMDVESDNENDDNIAIKSFIDTLKMLKSKVMIKPTFLNPVDAATEDTVAEFLWNTDKGNIVFTPEKEFVLPIVQRKIQKKSIEVSQSKPAQTSESVNENPKPMSHIEKEKGDGDIDLNNGNGAKVYSGKRDINPNDCSEQPLKENEVAPQKPAVKGTELEKLRVVDISQLSCEEMIVGIDYVDSLIAYTRKKGIESPEFLPRTDGMAVIIKDVLPGTAYTVKLSMPDQKSMKKVAAFRTLCYLKKSDSAPEAQAEHQQMDPKNKLQSYCQRNFAGKMPEYNNNKVTLPDGTEFTTESHGSKKEVERAAAQTALDAIESGRYSLSPLPPQKMMQNSQPIDPKNELQSYCQRNFDKKFPVYFENKVILPDGTEFTTEFRGNKKETEKAAAQVALDAIKSGSFQPQRSVSSDFTENKMGKVLESAEVPMSSSLVSVSSSNSFFSSQQDSKNELQSYCQRNFAGKMPVYDNSKVTLPDGTEFTVEFRGNKKETEKAAAQAALDAIESGRYSLPSLPPQKIVQNPQQQDPKNELQSYCQRSFAGKMPVYDNSKVILPDGTEFTVEFRGNKKETEKAAAQAALDAIKSGGYSLPPISPQKQPQIAQQVDPKNRLQSYCQRNFRGEMPKYFENKVILPDGREFTVEFRGNKKETEKAAAQAALDAIESGKSI